VNDSVEIGGKQFQFVRITVSKQAEIIRKIFRRKLFVGLMHILDPAGDNGRSWKKVRSVAFVKDWKWKYLRIIPKELRCSELSLRQSGELQASFFDYVAAEVNAHDAHLNLQTLLKTENEPPR
jgi:hypothetical protein